MKEMGLGAEYRYAHDEPNAYAAGENYFRPKWPRHATINRPRVGLKGKSAKSWHGWLSRIKIARQNATASEAVAVRLAGITLLLCGYKSAA